MSRSRALRLPVVLLLHFADAWNFSTCIDAAEAEIRRAPDKSEMFVTTSRLYKRHLAEYFCGMSEGMTALELGIYHGHTTAVLAAIFKKVISVDIQQEYLEIASNHVAGHSNVVFLSMNLMVDDWNIFAANPVNVVVIDANHDYEFVRADAENALRLLPKLQFLVFDDYIEEAVERAVTELENKGLLMECRGIGEGFDGSPWRVQDGDPETGETFYRTTRQSEGRICQRGRKAGSGSKVFPSFVDKRFLLYKQPLESMCVDGIFRFLADGTIKTSWKIRNARWLSVETAPGSKEDMLRVQAPGFAEMDLHFNSGRTAFMLSERGNPQPQWFGIFDQVVHRPFQFSSSLFWEQKNRKKWH